VSTFEIRINGIDVAPVVIIKDAQFTSAAKGGAGIAEFRIRDEGHLYSFTTGHSLTLDVDGQRVWAGFVAKIERGYFFEADCRCKTDIIPRYFKITGSDYNVLLHKRVLYDKDDPENGMLARFPVDTFDSAVLDYYLTNYTDLVDVDGVDLSLIEHVGTPSRDDVISYGPVQTVNQFLSGLSFKIGSIWYIDPDKVFVYTDVDTPNALYGLSDAPGAVVEEFRDDFDRTVASGWGSDGLGAWTAIAGNGVRSVDGTKAIIASYNNSSGTNNTRADITGLTELPFEFECELTLTRHSGTNGHGFTFNFSDALNTASTRILITVTTVASDNRMTLGLNAGGHNAGSTTIFSNEADWNGVSLRLKVRIDQAAVEGKLWKTSDPEPGSYQWEANPINPLADFEHLTISHAHNGAIGSHTASHDFIGLVGSAGGESIGYRELEIDFDGSALRNDALCWGVGQGSLVPVFSRVEDATSIAAHNRWQVGSMSGSIWRQATIDQVADTYVYGSPQNKRGGKDDAVAIKCTVFEPSFRVAQKVPFESVVFGYSDVIPIRYQKITFPSHQKVRFDLILSHEIDDPWTVFEFWFPDWRFDVPRCPDGSFPPCIDFPPLQLPPGDCALQCLRSVFTTGEWVGWNDFGGAFLDGERARLADGDTITSNPIHVVDSTEFTTSTVFRTLNSSAGESRLTVAMTGEPGTLGSVFVQVFTEEGQPWTLRVSGTGVGTPVDLIGDAWEDDTDYVLDLRYVYPTPGAGTVYGRLYRLGENVPEWQISSAEPTATMGGSPRLGLAVAVQSGTSYSYAIAQVDTCSDGTMETQWRSPNLLNCATWFTNGTTGFVTEDRLIIQTREESGVVGQQTARIVCQDSGGLLLGTRRLRFTPNANVTETVISGGGYGGSFDFTLHQKALNVWPPDDTLDPNGTLLAFGVSVPIGGAVTPIAGEWDIHVDHDGTAQIYIKKLTDGEGGLTVNTEPAVQYALPGTVPGEWAEIPDDPCSGGSPGAFSETPCGGARLCENLTPIAVPAGQPTDRAYFSTHHQWFPGTDEVWLDGLRVDYRDYEPDNVNQYIGFFAGIDTAGKTVHACYWSACMSVEV
jgi:hypothetical protein